jgi:ferredoxin
MKATVKEGCISCGLCIATCPEVFQFASDGLAVAITDPVPKENEGAAIEARDGCPVSVIEVK